MSIRFSFLAEEVEVKTKLLPMDIPDLEQAAKVFKKASKNRSIESSELAYTTTLLLSICQRGLSLNTEELELLDQALGLVMMKSAE